MSLEQILWGTVVSPLWDAIPAGLLEAWGGDGPSWHDHETHQHSWVLGLGTCWTGSGYSTHMGTLKQGVRYAGLQRSPAHTKAGMEGAGYAK